MQEDSSSGFGKPPSPSAAEKDAPSGVSTTTSEWAPPKRYPACCDLDERDWEIPTLEEAAQGYRRVLVELQVRAHALPAPTIIWWLSCSSLLLRGRLGGTVTTSV
jgi:hypothetical protein